MNQVNVVHVSSISFHYFLKVSKKKLISEGRKNVQGFQKLITEKSLSDYDNEMKLCELNTFFQRFFNCLKFKCT